MDFLIPLCLRNRNRLNFLSPLEHVPAEGSQACGQQEGQQHQDWRQDADHWEGRAGLGAADEACVLC